MYCLAHEEHNDDFFPASNAVSIVLSRIAKELITMAAIASGVNDPFTDD